MGPISDSDIVAITQLVNLYGLAVDSQRWPRCCDAKPTPDVSES
jgi:hypothetical protein